MNANTNVNGNTYRNANANANGRENANGQIARAERDAEKGGGRGNDIVDNSRSEKKQKANFFPGTLAKEEGRAKMSCTPWCAMNKITISANKFHYKTGGGCYN